MSKILFLANHFITLYSFRKELISRILLEGHEVFISLPKSDENLYFERMGCHIIETDIDRRGVNPLRDLKLLRNYKLMMKEIEPDIIFSYTIKPNIYGCFASNKLRFKQICNITGTGGTFLKNNLVSKICKFLYKRSIKNCYKVFFQNTGDKDFFVKNGLVKSNYDLLPGSGCNLKEHMFSELPDGDITRFIFIGRVMELKGIDEFLECAKIIKTKYNNVEFIIAGWNEEEKYIKIVKEFEERGFVNYIGFRKDVDEWIKKCHCTILPSRGGEGVPNVLLETAASGRICIGSNINGTKDVIDDNITGFLFEKGDAQSLIDKVERVLGLSFEERKQMCLAARKKIEDEFDRDIVINRYMEEL